MNGKIVVLASLLCLGVIVTPGVYGQENTEMADEESESGFLGSLQFSGNLHSTLTSRRSDSRDDLDIYEFLSLKFDDIIKDRVDGAFSMSWHEDLNGKIRLSGMESYDPFIDLDAAAGVRFRYYTGYLDFKELGFEESRLRVGRQFLETIDYAHFDGASYQFSPIDPLEITLFGGRPITYFSSTRGDAFYGSNIQYRFSPHTKAALRYYRYDADSFEDDLAAAELWHRFMPALQTHLEFSLLDGDPYLLQSDWAGRIDSIDLDALVQIVHLFESINDHTVNFNPYFPLLNGYEPFTHGSLFVSKGVNPWMSLTAGFDIREIESVNNPVTGFTNPDFVRYTAGAEFYPVDCITLSINGEFWDVDSGDEFTGITGELEYHPAPDWELSAGVDYGEYVQEFRDEFMLYAGQDKTFRLTPDVLTYHARVRWKPTRNVYTAATFEIEDSDDEDDEWYQLRLELGVHF